jgi:hypothetical protein
LPKLKQFADYASIRQAIMRMDDDLCNETLLANLIMYAPSQEDDLVAMEKYVNATPEECAALDLPEQFTIEVRNHKQNSCGRGLNSFFSFSTQMVKMYRYTERLRFMLFRAHFWEKLDQLNEVNTQLLHTMATRLTYYFVL